LSVVLQRLTIRCTSINILDLITPATQSALDNYVHPQDNPAIIGSV